MSAEFDEVGNSFDPATCPCCQGVDEFNPHALCDACTVAALAGEYPHGCDHTRNCPTHTEES